MVAERFIRDYIRDHLYISASSFDQEHFAEQDRRKIRPLKRIWKPSKRLSSHQAQMSRNCLVACPIAESCAMVDKMLMQCSWSLTRSILAVKARRPRPSPRLCFVAQAHSSCRFRDRYQSFWVWPSFLLSYGVSARMSLSLWPPNAPPLVALQAEGGVEMPGYCSLDKTP